MDCYKCEHKRPIPGDAHIRCAAVGEGVAQIAALINVESGRFNPRVLRLNSMGQRGGWCNWPINFDPVWVEHCAMFKGVAS